MKKSMDIKENETCSKKGKQSDELGNYTVKELRTMFKLFYNNIRDEIKKNDQSTPSIHKINRKQFCEILNQLKIFNYKITKKTLEDMGFKIMKLQQFFGDQLPSPFLEQVEFSKYKYLNADDECLIKTKEYLNNILFDIEENPDIKIYECFEYIYLTTKEHEFLQQYCEVAKKWGYRSKDDGDHDHYEHVTHDWDQDSLTDNGRGIMYFTQSYTDPIFRTIQQLCKAMHTNMKNKGMYDGDFSDKFEKQNDWNRKLFNKELNISESDLKLIQLFLLDFFCHHKSIIDAFKNIATYQLNSKENSEYFAFIILSSRALIYFALGEFKNGIYLIFYLLFNLRECSDYNLNESSSDLDERYKIYLKEYESTSSDDNDELEEYESTSSNDSDELKEY